MALAQDGSTVSASSAFFSVSITVTISTAGAGEQIVAQCSAGNGFGTISSNVSGATLGNFTQPAGASQIWGGGLIDNRCCFKWASAKLTSEVITYTLGVGTGSAGGFGVSAITGSQNMDGLTAGTDYAVNKVTGTSKTPVSNSITAKASGSWLIQGGGSSQGTSYTPDANDTITGKCGFNGTTTAGQATYGQQLTTPATTTAGNSYTSGGTFNASIPYGIATVEILAAASGTVIVPWPLLNGRMTH